MDINFDKKFEEAIFYVASVMPHSDKLPKPTLFHSLRVAFYLYTTKHNGNVCIAALLHDIVEDAGVNLDEIEMMFGSEIATLIQVNTKNYDIKDKNEMYEKLIRGCLEYGEDSAVIKAADILDNLKYFKKNNDQIAVEKLTKLATKLLELKPITFTDPIFENLKMELLL